MKLLGKIMKILEEVFFKVYFTYGCPYKPCQKLYSFSSLSLDKGLRRDLTIQRSCGYYQRLGT